MVSALWTWRPWFVLWKFFLAATYVFTALYGDSSDTSASGWLRPCHSGTKAANAAWYKCRARTGKLWKLAVPGGCQRALLFLRFSVCWRSRISLRCKIHQSYCRKTSAIYFFTTEKSIRIICSSPSLWRFSARFGPGGVVPPPRAHHSELKRSRDC